MMPERSKEGTLGCNKIIKNGTAVAAYGHPKGLKFSASRGIISKQRFLYGKEVIQTDAAINSGNSGGPLIDLESGLIVGINKSSIKESSGIGLCVCGGAEFLHKCWLDICWKPNFHETSNI